MSGGLHVENDAATTTRWEPIESHVLTAEKSRSGLWIVTGSMHKGLMVTGRNLGEALSRVEGAWDELKQAAQESARAKATCRSSG
jgi:hypothetical protein